MRLKVAQVIDDTGIGGAQSLVATAARVLGSRGVETVVISLREHADSPVAAQLGADGIEVVNVPALRARSLTDRERLRRLGSVLRDGHFDVVQTHLLYGNVLGSLASRGAGLPTVATLHQTSRAPRRLERERELLEAVVLRRRAARAIAVGSAVADAYRGRLGCVPIDVVTNPISTATVVSPATRAVTRREILGSDDPASRLILAVGRLEARKGYDTLLEAFAPWAGTNPGAKLAIAGEGPMRSQLESLARSLGVERQIRLLGERSDVQELLGAADLFVMSSTSEGLPLALLEAMVAGIPILATRVGDIPDVVGDTGELVHAGDPAALTEAIRRVMEHPEEAGARAERARARVLDRHGLEHWADRMLEVYSDAIEHSILQRRPFSIAVLSHGYKPRIGGIERQRAATSEFLARRGLRVSVLTRAVPQSPRFEVLDRVVVRRLRVLHGGDPPGRLGRIERPINSAAWTAQALWHLVRLRPDVIHVDEILSTARAGLIGGRMLGVPVIVVIHSAGAEGDVGRNLRTRHGRRLVRAVCRNAVCVVSVSREIDEEVARAGITRDRRLVLFNGVDTNAFAPATSGEREILRHELGLGDEFLAVFTGRIVPGKRLDRVMKVWPSVSEVAPGATFIAVGGGPGVDALLPDAHDGVRFIGRFDDVRPFLRAADIFVLPSDSEGNSCALLEAQATGLPAVVTDVGSSRDVIDQGMNGFIVPREDEASLRDRLCTLAVDPELRTAMSAAARSSAQKRFALESVGRTLGSLYSAVARGESLDTMHTAEPSGDSK